MNSNSIDKQEYINSSYSNSFTNFINSFAFSSSKNSGFVTDGMSFGFFFLKITNLFTSNSLAQGNKSGLALSPISVKIMSLFFLAITSNGALFVSVALNPSS